MVVRYVDQPTLPTIESVGMDVILSECDPLLTTSSKT
jgi:hypothetical protein